MDWLHHGDMQDPRERRVFYPGGPTPDNHNPLQERVIVNDLHFELADKFLEAIGLTSQR
jgi:hypothetical protein